jgi:hypothetical protein
MRARRFAIPLVVSLLAALAPGRGRAAASARATCREFPGMNVLFRFGTGTRPSGPPAVAPDGSLYVGTDEGYVHALRADGSFHWSYTVRGAVTGRLALSESGSVLVPAPRTIYALRPDGRLLWAFNSPVEVRGDLVRDASGRYHFASADGRVFAITSRGALVSHLPSKQRLSAGPLALPDGGLVAGRGDGSVLLSFRGVLSRFQLEGPVFSLLTCPGARFCAIGGGVLQSFGTRKDPFRTPAVGAAANGELLAVLSTDERFELFRGTSGERRVTVTLPEPASAAPVLDARGTSYVPLANGALLVVGRDGAVSGCVPVASSALGVPVLDAARRRVLVTASEGVLAAIELP